MLSDELERLKKLLDQGAIDEEEYKTAKKRILESTPPIDIHAEPVDGYQLFGLAPNTYAMMIHLSQFAVFVLPLAGCVLPIVLWLLGKDKDGFVDRHGRAAVNWIISEFIYGIVFGVLIFVLIGIPLMMVLVILGVIFPIFAAIAANDYREYTYPLSIQFLK